jgi:hypothetical protein
MSDNIVRMQHASKGLAGFSHSGVSVSSDEEGVIEVPSHLSDHAKAHGFVAMAVRAAPKPLAKSAKGGKKSIPSDESDPEEEDASKATEKGPGEDTDEADLKKAEEAKTAQKGAKSAKGGAE